VGDEETGFPDEPTFNLAALAGQEQLQERIRDLENERAAMGRERAAEPERCEHAFASHHVPRHRLYWVRQCLLCHEVDWDDLDTEVDGIVRAALSSLAAELDAEAERELAHRHDSMAARVIAPSTAVTYRAAARMALRRAGVDPDEPGHASASHDKAEHARGAQEGSQRVQSDGAP